MLLPPLSGKARAQMSASGLPPPGVGCAAPSHSPPHQRLVDRGPQVKDVVADSQVVLQAEGLQHHAVPHGECEPQLVIVIGCTGEEPVSPGSRGTRHAPLAACPARVCEQGHSSWAVCLRAHQTAPGIFRSTGPHPEHPCIPHPMHPILVPTCHLPWKP